MGILNKPKTFQDQVNKLVSTSPSSLTRDLFPIAHPFLVPLNISQYNGEVSFTKKAEVLQAALDEILALSILPRLAETTRVYGSLLQPLNVRPVLAQLLLFLPEVLGELLDEELAPVRDTPAGSARASPLAGKDEELHISESQPQEAEAPQQDAEAEDEEQECCRSGTSDRSASSSASGVHMGHGPGHPFKSPEAPDYLMWTESRSSHTVVYRAIVQAKTMEQLQEGWSQVQLQLVAYAADLALHNLKHNSKRPLLCVGTSIISAAALVLVPEGIVTVDQQGKVKIDGNITEEEQAQVAVKVKQWREAIASKINSADGWQLPEGTYPVGKYYVEAAADLFLPFTFPNVLQLAPTIQTYKLVQALLLACCETRAKRLTPERVQQLVAQWEGRNKAIRKKYIRGASLDDWK